MSVNSQTIGSPLQAFGLWTPGIVLMRNMGFHLKAISKMRYDTNGYFWNNDMAPTEVPAVACRSANATKLTEEIARFKVG